MDWPAPMRLRVRWHSYAFGHQIFNFLQEIVRPNVHRCVRRNVNAGGEIRNADCRYARTRGSKQGTSLLVLCGDGIVEENQIEVALRS